MSTDDAAARLRRLLERPTSYSGMMEDLRALLDERDAQAKDGDRLAWKVLSLVKERDALRAEVETLRNRESRTREWVAVSEDNQALRERLEAAERVWKSAEDATWAFAALGGAKLEEYVEELRHACREYRERFGGRNDLE